MKNHYNIFQASVMKSIILLPLYMLARTRMISIFVTTITFFWRHLNIANELSWHIHEKKSAGCGIPIHRNHTIKVHNIHSEKAQGRHMG